MLIRNCDMAITWDNNRSWSGPRFAILTASHTMYTARNTATTIAQIVKAYREGKGSNVWVEHAVDEKALTRIVKTFLLRDWADARCVWIADEGIARLTELALTLK